jgi:hypothetical protein
MEGATRAILAELLVAAAGRVPRMMFIVLATKARKIGAQRKQHIDAVLQRYGAQAVVHEPLDAKYAKMRVVVVVVDTREDAERLASELRACDLMVSIIERSEEETRSPIELAETFLEKFRRLLP